MSGRVDFDLIEKLKEALITEIEDHGIGEKELALLLEDNPGYIDDAIDDILSEVYQLINDYVTDTVEADIMEIMEAQPESTEALPKEEEEEERKVAVPLTIDYDEKIEYSR